MSAHGVVRHVFPRTDFPQWGWLRTATGTLFEASSGWQVPPYEALWASYRTPHWTTAARSRERQLLYTDFPQHGWLITGANQLPEAVRWPAMAFQSAAFRLRERLDTHRIPAEWTQWIRGIEAFNAATWPAIATGSAFSYRTPDRDNQPRGEWSQWVQGIEDAAFNAAFYASIEQLVRSLRSTERHLWIPASQPNTDWRNALNLWEVPYFTGIGDQSRAFLANRRTPWKHFQQHDQPSQDWIFSGLPPPYSAAMYAALEQALRSSRWGKELTRVSVWTDVPQFGWITPSIPAPAEVLQNLKSLVLDLGGIGLTLVPSGNTLPIEIITSAPSGAPPANKGVVFMVSGGTLTIYVWTGTAWVSLP